MGLGTEALDRAVVATDVAAEDQVRASTEAENAWRRLDKSGKRALEGSVIC